MPWTKEDVEKHIKGLSDAQKEAWVKIANGTLNSCMSGGKERGFCEGYAVRIANAKAKGVGESDKLWTQEEIKYLPDSSFAFIESKDKRHFPYKDKDGNVSVLNLKECLLKVLSSPIAERAMPKLKAAAKQVKIGEYADDWKGGEGYFTSAINIKEYGEAFNNNPRYKPNEEKREIILPLMKEGRGNKRDNNYYSVKAVTEAASYLQARKKMFLNHPKDESDDRDIRDWAGSIQETWVDKLPDNTSIVFGRVRAIKNDAGNWLWETAKSAPEDLATSILGRGRSKRIVMDGSEVNLIESIEYIKSCDFVDYPGNTPLGMVYFVESAKFDEKGNIIEEQKTKQEEKTMEWKDITLASLKENKPELVADIEESAVQASKKEIETLKTTISEKEATVKDLTNKVDSFEVKEKLSAKKTLVEKLLKGSDLPEEAKTDVLREQLMECQEKKIQKEGKEAIVTVEERMKTLIEDRAKILGKKGVVNMGHEESSSEVKETEAQDAVCEGIFGLKKKEEKK